MPSSKKPVSKKGSRKGSNKDAANGGVTWDVIKTYFRPIDVTHMKNQSGGQLDLSDCASVKQNAQDIYDMVSQGQMPPGKPWPQEWVDNFKSWMDGGAQCPS